MTKIVESSTHWPAPAKVNLFLNIIGRRQDGYHLLQTVFQLLEHGDFLSFFIRSDSRIQRNTDIPGIPHERDLIVRAARLLQQTSGVNRGVDIRVDKRLPMGGGLGGGSSDAATTLVALNWLWGCGLTGEQLISMGVTLGADVPVFIHGYSAWAEGVGEQLQRLELPRRWILVINPPVEVSTAAVFSTRHLTRNSPPITITDFFNGATANVLEPVVRQAYTKVAQALDWLTERVRPFGVEARLTGTGSCVFASFTNRLEAAQVLEQVPQGWEGFVAKGVNRSPLLDRLASESV